MEVLALVGRRKLVAVLACRNEGTRLFGKPLQRLDTDVTILEQIISAIQVFGFIDETTLAISSGTVNEVFAEIARARGCRYHFGDPDDVLLRVVEGARMTEATDVFRVTTECPFFDYSELERAWELHVRAGSDITVLDHVPEGTGFEIYTRASLERSHADGSAEDRSEFCSNYARRNADLFHIEIIRPRPEVARLDLRLTVDYPEDLILCRSVYQALSQEAPLIPLEKIVAFVDSRPDLKDLTAPYVVPEPLWDK